MECRIWITRWIIFYIIYLRLFWVYIKKKHEKKPVTPSIIIYINKIENKHTFKVKTGYYLELLTPEIKKLLRGIKSKITNNEHGENVPYLEITEAALTYGNVISNNNNQQKSRVLYTFVPNKSFSQFRPKIFIFLKTFDWKFGHIEVWFTDQNSNPLQIKDKINTTLATN